MQVRHVLGKTRQAFTPDRVLDQHKGLKCSTVAIQCILVGFDRADDQFNRVIFHIHPGHIRSLVVIGLQGLGTQLQVSGKFFVFRQGRCLYEQFSYFVDLCFECLAVRHQYQRIIGIPFNDGVQAVLTFLLPGFEF